MLYYDRTDVSEGISVNEINNSHGPKVLSIQLPFKYKIYIYIYIYVMAVMRYWKSL